MSETGVLIFIGCIIGVAVLGALIAVIAAVSGASAKRICKTKARRSDPACLFIMRELLFGSIKSKIKIKYRFINL